MLTVVWKWKHKAGNRRCGGDQEVTAQWHCCCFLLLTSAAYSLSVQHLKLGSFRKWFVQHLQTVFFLFILLTYKVPQIWLCNFLVSFPLNTICVFCCIFACVVTCAHRLIALAIAFVVLNSLLLCLTYVPSISLFITLHFTCLLR